MTGMWVPTHTAAGMPDLLADTLTDATADTATDMAAAGSAEGPFPFKGIIEDRPYAETGLTTALWIAEVRPVLVDIRRLWLTQRRLTIMALFGVLDRDSDLYPHVVAFGGELYLEDGHHRVARRVLLAGNRYMWMRVYHGSRGQRS